MLGSLCDLVAGGLPSIVQSYVTVVIGLPTAPAPSTNRQYRAGDASRNSLGVVSSDHRAKPAAIIPGDYD